MNKSNYAKYRGKCKDLCDLAIQADPSLRLVRGHYYEPMWNSNEQHWWTERPDGSIFDPSVKQFPSAGSGIYTEFDGNVTCEECGKVIKEEDMILQGRFPTCSIRCATRLVGL